MRIVIIPRNIYSKNKNLENLAVLVYTYMEMCYIDFAGLNLYGNLLN